MSLLKECTPLCRFYFLFNANSNDNPVSNLGKRIRVHVMPTMTIICSSLELTGSFALNSSDCLYGSTLPQWREQKYTALLDLSGVAFGLL